MYLECGHRLYSGTISSHDEPDAINLLIKVQTDSKKKTQTVRSKHPIYPPTLGRPTQPVGSHHSSVITLSLIHI